MRLLPALALAVLACDGGSAPVDAPLIDAGVDTTADAAADAVVDANPFDGPDCDGGCAGVGEICGSSDVDLDAGARTCGPGLVCCYPCGVANCADRCTEPCTPAGGPGCQQNGCPGPFP